MRFSKIPLRKHCLPKSTWNLQKQFPAQPFRWINLFQWVKPSFPFSRNQSWNILLSSDDANIIRPTIKKDSHLFQSSHRMPAAKKSMLPTHRSIKYHRRKHAVTINLWYLLLRNRANTELFCAFLFMVAYMPFGYSLSDISHITFYLAFHI